METNKLTLPQPLQTVPFEFVVNLYNEVSRLRQRVDMLESYLLGDWLTRQEAMAYLHISSTKLWELTKSLSIVHTRIGTKPLYSYQSCQEYLSKNGISKADIDRRIQEILSAKKRK